VKFRSWLETKDVRPIPTGGEFLVTHKGDHVIVAVIEKWDDVEAAIKALQTLTRSPSGDET
jgi:hypothetical protein